jgi:hypothetical protein
MAKTVSLIRRTTFRCGRVERSIVHFLMGRYPHTATVEEVLAFVERHGPTNGKLLHLAWKGVKGTVERYGPRKGKTLEHALEALRRLEKRNIVTIK